MLSRVDREKCYEETDTAKAHRERTQKLIVPAAPDPHLHHSWECVDCLTPPPPPEHVEPRLIEVEQILSKQFVKDPQDPRLTVTYYLVKWKDYEVRQASWEPSYNLVFGDSDSLPLVKEFESRQNPEIYPNIRAYERDVHDPTSYTFGTAYSSATGSSLQKRFARRSYVPMFPNYVRTFPTAKDKEAHTYVGEFNCTRVSEYHDVRYPYGTHTDREPSYVYPTYPLSRRTDPDRGCAQFLPDYEDRGSVVYNFSDRGQSSTDPSFVHKTGGLSSLNIAGQPFEGFGCTDFGMHLAVVEMHGRVYIFTAIAKFLSDKTVCPWHLDTNSLRL